MADPTIAEFGTEEKGTSTSAATYTVPGVAGDLAILVYRVRFTHANSAPTSFRAPTVTSPGWSPIINADAANIGVSLTTRTALYTFWKINDGDDASVDVSAATGGDLTREVLFQIGLSAATGLDTDENTQDDNSTSWPTDAQSIAVTKLDSRIFSIIAAGAGGSPTLYTANGFSVDYSDADTPAVAVGSRGSDSGTYSLPQWDGGGQQRVQVGFTVVNAPTPEGGGIYIDGAIHLS